MDGFQLTIVSMAFSDSQWKDDWNAIAEKRRAELLGEAEYRPALEETNPTSGRNPWRAAVRDGLLALRARVSPSRRQELASPIALVPAAPETT